MGRCEDIANRTTYAARAVSLATATDFTPAWAHRDNNHAWNVLLDAARTVERVPELLGLSPHLIATATHDPG